jgi:Type II CAAX prenyl endopeptidase Rce1-like
MNRAYWQASRAPRYSLLFALPLLLVYQTLTLLVPTGPLGGVRNGADVVLQTLFISVAGAQGPLLFMIALVGTGLWLVAKDMRARGARLTPQVFGLMLAESVGLALVVGVIVGGLTAALLGTPLLTVQGAARADPLGAGTLLMLSLGAGIYEELLFRVLLVGALAWVAQQGLGWRPQVAGGAAAVVGALLFAAFHYIGAYGDPLEVYSFVFRTIGGLFFSVLYLLRGFGITAWTHALYDVFLVFR